LIEGGEPATCYPAPAFRNTLKELGAAVSDDRVIVSGKLVTSQGPGTSLEFALQLGEELFGKDKRDEIAKQMLVS
jgi:putative intracellular protease/amidase